MESIIKSSCDTGWAHWDVGSRVLGWPHNFLFAHVLLSTVRHLVQIEIREECQ